MEALLIEAAELELGYGSRIVLGSVNLRVAEGEVCGFRGPNGSGKTTFLKACLGFLPVAGGSLRVLGGTPRRKGYRTVLTRIGYVPQQRPPGRLRLTVREAVALGRCGIAGLGRPLGAEDRRAVEEALTVTGMDGLADRTVQELSGGQYQRTNIARALAMRPELLIFDEPLSNLDARGRADVAALVGRLAGGRTGGMLLVSHEEELLTLCGRVYEFGRGTVRQAVPAAAQTPGGEPS